MLNALVALKLVGVVAGVSLASTGAAAATGKLPDPVQSVAAASASHVGVKLPDPKKPVAPKVEKKDSVASTSTTEVEHTSTTVTTAVPDTSAVPTPLPHPLPPTACGHEAGDDGCSHVEKPEKSEKSEKSEGESAEHRQNGKAKSTVSTTTAVKHTENKGTVKPADDVKKSSPTTSSPGTTTPKVEESHPSKGKGADD